MKNKPSCRVGRRFFQQREAQASLSGAGHPHANCVRGEIFGVVQELLRGRLPSLQIVLPPQIELTELLVIKHASRPINPAHTLEPPRHSL